MRPVAKKELGQHFLVDENLLGVIGRLAELDPGDVVLEVGPGLGVLTAYLAERTRHVHAVELDRSLEPRLAESLAGRENVELHFGDALQLDLAALEPAPTKLVSNLPYNIATPLVAESLDGLPSVELWTVMVQREVADRFFAQPSTKAYGAVSVLVQLAAERTGFHPVSRTVFRPQPNVDSALVAFRRRTTLPESYPRVKQVVGAAFAHRRKRLPNSLELAGARHARGGRRRARGDRPGPGRPRRGAGPAGVRRARRGARPMRRAAATAKLNLALVVGPLRDDGRHEVVTVLQRLDLADRISVEPAPELRVEGFPEDTLVRRALESLAAAAGTEPHWEATIWKHVPVAAGLGGGSSDAATALRLANETLPEPLPVEALAELAASLGSDVPFFLTSGPQLATGTGTDLTPLELPQDYWVVLVLPARESKASTAAVYEAFDRRNGSEGFEQRRARLDENLPLVRRPRDLASLPPNDLATSPLADELLGLGAFRADVSGAGPVVYGLFLHREPAVAAERELRARGRTWLTVPTWYG